MKNLFLVSFYMLTVRVLSKNIPSFVHLCKRDDPNLSKCVNTTFFEMIPRMIKGIPEMNIPPIEPLTFKTISINTGKGTAVSIEATLSNGTLYGISNVALPKHEVNIETVRHSAIMKLPYINLKANYKIKGKLMLFEINSEGRAEVNATDLVFDAKWYGHHYLDKGKKYMYIDKIDFEQAELHNMVLKFEDFDKERHVLMETVNKAVNDNIDSLLEELNVLIKQTVGEVAVDFFNRVYTSFPTDQLYPES